MLDFRVISSSKELQENSDKGKVVDFLFEHLDEFGDSKEAIGASIDYAMSESEGMGGFILLAEEGEEIRGAVVMIKTGMKHYIPENILVYIAVHKKSRNQGLGGNLLRRSKSLAQGNIALHVEYDNPAKRLYEREGFVSKYAEMRFTRG